MRQTYAVTGMTCSGCQAKVEALLSAVPGVHSAAVYLANSEAVIDKDSSVSAGQLAAALKGYPKYQLTTKIEPVMTAMPEEKMARSWLQTYKPILLIFGYLSGITLIAAWTAGPFLVQKWMTYFMGGFFLIFSFFKMLNLRGFAESYAMYDLLAKNWNGWGYLYAFLELGLGIAFLTGFKPFFTTLSSFLLMTVSIVGVLQSVLGKRKIQCACLGAVFDLPMSTVTILEDLLMIVMSGLMLMMMF